MSAKVRQDEEKKKRKKKEAGRKTVRRLVEAPTVADFVTSGHFSVGDFLQGVAMSHQVRATMTESPDLPWMGAPTETITWGGSTYILVPQYRGYEGAWASDVLKDGQSKGLGPYANTPEGANKAAIDEIKADKFSESQRDTFPQPYKICYEGHTLKIQRMAQGSGWQYEVDPGPGISVRGRVPLRGWAQDRVEAVRLARLTADQIEHLMSTPRPQSRHTEDQRAAMSKRAQQAAQRRARRMKATNGLMIEDFLTAQRLVSASTRSVRERVLSDQEDWDMYTKHQLKGFLSSFRAIFPAFTIDYGDGYSLILRGIPADDPDWGWKKATMGGQFGDEMTAEVWRACLSTGGWDPVRRSVQRVGDTIEYIYDFISKRHVGASVRKRNPKLASVRRQCAAPPPVTEEKAKRKMIQARKPEMPRPDTPTRYSIVLNGGQIHSIVEAPNLEQAQQLAARRLKAGDRGALYAWQRGGCQIVPSDVSVLEEAFISLVPHTTALAIRGRQRDDDTTVQTMLEALERGRRS